MVSFDEQLAADMDLFLNEEEFASAAVYNDGATEIPVIVDESNGKSTGKNDTAAIAYVSESDVPAPEYRDTITVNGITWTVDQHPGRGGYPKAGGVWRLPLTRGQKVKSWT